MLSSVSSSNPPARLYAGTMIVTSGCRSVPLVVWSPPAFAASFIGASGWYLVVEPRPDHGVAAGRGPEDDAGDRWADGLDHVLARRDPPRLAGEHGQDGAPDALLLDAG